MNALLTFLTKGTDGIVAGLEWGRDGVGDPVVAAGSHSSRIVGGVLKYFRQAGAELDVKLKEEEIFLIVSYNIQWKYKSRTPL